VATYIGNLTKHYCVEFIGEKETLIQKAFDLNKELKRFGLVVGVYGSGSLDSLTRRFENNALNKDHAIYKCSCIIFQREKIQY
jgi:hypothetical protein